MYPSRLLSQAYTQISHTHTHTHKFLCKAPTVDFFCYLGILPPIMDTHFMWWPWTFPINLCMCEYYPLSLLGKSLVVKQLQMHSYVICSLQQVLFFFFLQSWTSMVVIFLIRAHDTAHTAHTHTHTHTNMLAHINTIIQNLYFLT